MVRIHQGTLLNVKRLGGSYPIQEFRDEYLGQRQMWYEQMQGTAIAVNVVTPRARMCCAHAWCYVIASEFLENWEQAVVLLELQCCNTNRRLRLFWCSRPGGFASVWLCNDTRRDKNKLVALKVPVPQSFCHFLAHLLSTGLNTRLMQHFCVDAKRIASEVQSSRPLPKICARGGVKLSFCHQRCIYIYIYIYIYIFNYIYQRKFSWETSDIRTTSQSNRIAA